VQRSATDSSVTVPGLKREPSATPSLSLFPLAPGKARGRRDSVASLRHLKARQVSLNDMTTASDQRRKRKQPGEDELRDAIDAIKKPNRGMVGRELADERDQRKTGKPTKSVRSSGPRTDRKSLQTSSGIKVLATPHHGRTIDHLSQDLLGQQALPASDIDNIPSSGIRGSMDGDLIPGTVGQSQRRAGFRPGMETPSRTLPRKALFRNSEANGVATTSNEVTIQQTPCKARPKSAAWGSLKQPKLQPLAHGSPNVLSSKSSAEDSLTTPRKVQRPVEDEAILQTPNNPAMGKQSNARAGERDDIYAALGWNEELDDV
jgi:DNA replication regulator SLD3